MPDLKPGFYLAQSADHSQTQLKLKGAVLSAYYPMLNILKKLEQNVLDWVPKLVGTFNLELLCPSLHLSNEDNNSSSFHQGVVKITSLMVCEAL